MCADRDKEVGQARDVKEQLTDFADWDVTKEEPPETVLQSAFRLAYFLSSERAAAIDIVIRALDKIKVRSRQEFKRVYWRDKHLGRPLRRISRSDLDLLQWLIMVESEKDEREQERSGSVPQRKMV